ncbi:nuclease (SNase domain protein) [Thermanaerovibrio acidaminovorans DSM 6589]|uniref:Nuclease (SNase domain protein) n=1 Tax=Thermanaerovibrio acidaminovorans (strain ATCC 49978 / DSM 6589 / Su883) TaxID=525903 RepID=D1B7E5_THEAS|nr:nuclease (SNase domain protein) [Thermanaerovibrio acidaminovorans DSM 6589]
MRVRGRGVAPWGRRWSGRVLWALLALGSILLSLRGGQAQAPGKLVPVAEVLDGDTIRVRLNGKEETVRYLYVDTPELHHPQRGEEEFGREAWEANRSLLASGEVGLSFDRQRRDKYGRLLATPMVRSHDGGWVWVTEELARRGLCLAMEVPPNDSGTWRIRAAVAEAKANRRGLWGPSASRGRGYTEGQLKSVAGKLLGRWVRVSLVVRSVSVSRSGGVTIRGDRNFLFVQSYRGVWDFDSIRPGDRLVIWGCLSRSPRGWHVRWVDPAQRME